MPHYSLKLIPGVDTTKTPTLNEAALSSSNLIRFLPDADGAVPQKLGGWVKYFPNAFPSKIRALKAWEDLNTNLYLGVGTETSLSYISNGVNTDISPTTLNHTFAPNFSATLGSNVIQIVDTGSNANTNSFVCFLNPVSVAGIILSGAFPISTQVDVNTYQILAPYAASYSTSQTATITIASPAVITVANAPTSGTTVQFTTTGALPTGITAGTTYFVQQLSSTTFNIALTPTGTPINTSGTQSGVQTAVFPGQVTYLNTTSGSASIAAMLPQNNYVVGESYAISSSTLVFIGGLTLFGAYNIYSVSNDNTDFTFIASNTATSNASAFVNSGNVAVTYYLANEPASPATGYSFGAYSSGAYSGAAVPASGGIPITATDWFLDNWGQILIACPVGGAIYAWQPNSPIPNAQYIQNAPLFNNGAFVAMPQRQIVAWGSTFTSIIDPLLIRWCDVENYNVWIASSVNQAGSYRIPSGSRIISGMQASQQGLFWTDIDLWAMQYIGAPLVYGFNKIASNCGLIAEKAVGQLNNTIYWMSQRQFFMMSGGGVQPIVCPVWDVVFQNINLNYVNKIRCAVNSTFNEISWYYPSSTSTEIDSYVKYNTVLQKWDYGSLGRTAWIDQSILGTPIGSGTDNYIYQHEQGYSAAGTALNASFTTGYFSVADGDQLAFIDQIWPDMKWGTYNGAQNETIYITVNAVNYPTDTPISYGPFAMTSATEYISCRIRARLISFTINSSDAAETFWRLGRIRYRAIPDGKF